jgi:hypothetical protein
MTFIAEAFGAWVIQEFGNAARKRAAAWLRGSDQERALRAASQEAIGRAAADLTPGTSETDVDGLGRALDQVFRIPALRSELSTQNTFLESLDAGLRDQLAALDDAELTGVGSSYSDIVGISTDQAATALTGQLLRCIRVRGAAGGPLAALADQLNHDISHLQERQNTGLLQEIVNHLRDTAPPAPARTFVSLAADIIGQEIGVHRPIHGSFSDPAAEPLYVGRQFDAQLQEAIAVGGIVVLRGSSTTGKTRSLAEAIRVVLPTWQFADCRDHSVVSQLTIDSDVVIWLDELRPTSSPGSLAASLRPILERGRVLVAATTRPPSIEDRHELDELTSLGATVIPVSDEWTQDERLAAAELANQDYRLAIALRDQDFGPAQVLGGAPRLIHLWDDAQGQALGAVLAAAVDLARLGAAVVADETLTSAATGYLRHSPHWRPTWYSDAMATATALSDGAVSALIPQPDATFTTTVGYRLSDALHEYGDRRRHWMPIPESTWLALVHASTSTEIHQLAKRARDWLLYSLAKSLEAHANEHHDRQSEPRTSVSQPTPVAAPAASQQAAQPQQPPTLRVTSPDRTKAERLYNAKDIDGLRSLGRRSNDTYVRARLARLLAELDLEDELFTLAITSRRAARTTAEVLCRTGRLDELLRHVVCGDGFARRALTDWPIPGLDDQDRARILERGLTPDGTPF